MSDFDTRPCPEQHPACSPEAHQPLNFPTRFDGGCIHYWRKAAFDLAESAQQGQPCSLCGDEEGDVLLGAACWRLVRLVDPEDAEIFDALMAVVLAVKNRKEARNASERVNPSGASEEMPAPRPSGFEACPDGTLANAGHPLNCCPRHCDHHHHDTDRTNIACKVLLSRPAAFDDSMFADQIYPERDADTGVRTSAICARPRAEKWIDSPPPGGMVCARCGNPTESEPCDQHGPEAIARQFHETYERLAPEHGYITRGATRVPWADVPEMNRRLMQAVVADLLALGVIA